MPVVNYLPLPTPGFSIAIIVALHPTLVLPGEISQSTLAGTVVGFGIWYFQILVTHRTTIMSPDDTLRLHEFLRIAEAERLGEGDLIAGANTLAAMAIRARQRAGRV